MLEEDSRAKTISQISDPEENGSDYADPPGCGWVACTTDGVLAIKEKLYDVLVTMPPNHSVDAVEKAWPEVESPRGKEMKATQRDLRRYKCLQKDLNAYIRDIQTPSTTSEVDTEHMGDSMTTLRPSTVNDIVTDDTSSVINEKIVEPLSWSELAYSGFMWWASAGEKRSDRDYETENDQALLTNLDDIKYTAPTRPTPTHQPPTVTMSSRRLSTTTAPEMALIAYFHRLTSLLLCTLADIIDSTEIDDEEENELESENVFVSSEDLAKMGLDVWSTNDREFVENFVMEYFGRQAEVEGGRVECCGVKIC